jgi:hypothetical protein
MIGFVTHLPACTEEVCDVETGVFVVPEILVVVHVRGVVEAFGAGDGVVVD